jgi:hypothetical protein
MDRRPLLVGARGIGVDRQGARPVFVMRMIDPRRMTEIWGLMVFVDGPTSGRGLESSTGRSICFLYLCSPLLSFRNFKLVFVSFLISKVIVHSTLSDSLMEIQLDVDVFHLRKLCHGRDRRSCHSIVKASTFA